MTMMESLLNSPSTARRMLVYLLIDTSGSMHGAPIHAVQEGIDFLVRNLKATPEAVEMVHLSVVTFNNGAVEAAKLEPLHKFRAPNLSCGGGTNMEAGLQLLDRLIDRDFRENKGGQQRGDYRPLVFLLTDGDPTDSVSGGDPVEAAARAGQTLQNRPSGKSIGTFLALGCGPHVNVNVLKRVAKNVAMMNSMTDDNLKKFFQWLSASIATTSRAASRPANDEGGSEEAPAIPNGEGGKPAFKFEF